MKKFIDLSIISILMALVISSVSCSNFGAGSYCRGEDFEFNTSSDNLIKRIMLLKEKHPELNVWSTNQEGELYNLDGPDPDGAGEYFYSFYFRFPVKGKNAVVHTVVRIDSDYPASLMLSGVSYSPNLGNWEDMYDLKEKGKVEEKEDLEAAFKKYVLDEIGYEPQ